MQGTNQKKFKINKINIQFMRKLKAIIQTIDNVINLETFVMNEIPVIIR